MSESSLTPSKLRQPWLGLARVGWILLVSIALGVTVTSLPDYYGNLLTRRLSEFLGPEWTPALANQAITALHLTPGLITGYVVALDLIRVVIFLSIGILIFWRKSDEMLGLFASYVLIYIGLAIGGRSTWYESLPTIWQQILGIPLYIGWPCFFIFLNLYPDGRYVPFWLRFLTPLWILFGIATSVLIPSSETPGFAWIVPAFVVVFMGIGGQIYRYFKVANSVQRLQLRWFVFALVTMFGGLLASQYLLSPLIPPTTPQYLAYRLLDQFLQDALMSLLPISIAIALFRYRLWDLDFIIRRTLIYGVITAMLGLMYFGAVAVLQSVFVTLTGEHSALAVIVSTLAIAALFNPLRSRVQTFVDRRFYRRKYDAEHTLEAFAESLRDEVDIEHLQAALVGVVEETMQPESINLWIKTGEL